MGKRPKPAKKTTDAPSRPPASHPPPKRPVLLAVSMVLFGLWLVFLIAAAVWK